MKSNEIFCDRCGKVIEDNACIDGLFGKINLFDTDNEERCKDEVKTFGENNEVEITVCVRDEINQRNMDLCKECKKIYIWFIKKYINDLMLEKN